MKFVKCLGETVQVAFWFIILWALTIDLLDRVVEVKVFRYAAF